MVCLLFFTACCLLPAAYSQEFDRIVIDANFPGAYQVEVADVNGDKKPDVIAVGGSTCAWYENPTWKKRIVTGPKQTPGIISSATADLDGDGKAEIAIAYEFGMNPPTKGKLLLAVQGKGLDDPWKLSADRVISAASTGFAGATSTATDGRPVVAPIFGPEANRRVTSSRRPRSCVSTGNARTPHGELAFEKLSVDASCCMPSR